MTDTIPDAAMEAASKVLSDYCSFMTDGSIRNVLKAALPHLVGERDAEIAESQTALRTIARLLDGQRSPVAASLRAIARAALKETHQSLTPEQQRIYAKALRRSVTFLKESEG